MIEKERMKQRGMVYHTLKKVPYIFLWLRVKDKLAWLYFL